MTFKQQRAQNGWDDTPQQKAILRQNPTARKVRADYPVGQRVSTDRMDGTVYRHVPTGNAQGGHVVVDWDNGCRGRISPIAIHPIEK
jgi:hypothetical protein